MDTKSFESSLYRLSCKAIHALSGNTQDPITVQEAIEHNAYFRPISGCVQILMVDFSKEENYCDIHFVLSPKFMMRNYSLTLNGALTELSWIFGIQSYDYGEDEDGVDGWLMRSKIKVNYDKIYIAELGQEEFTLAIKNTEYD
jgi:hypothetical protein